MAVEQRELFYLTIHEAQNLIRLKTISPVELTQAFLDRIDSVDGKLHAYVSVRAEEALAEARTAEAEILQGQYRGPLHGIPLAVKDQYDIKGLPAAIRMIEPNNYESTEDATAVARLRGAGAVLLGKLMMSGQPGNLPQTCNPWNLDFSPGGSSTGPGAATAAGLCMASLGEDTAGSIRNPASLSGLIGLKPTYGLVSRTGLAPLSWSLDHSGPMTWVVEDIAHMLQVMAGYDAKDPTSIPTPIPHYAESLREDLKGCVIGVPRDYIEETKARLDSEILALVDQALGQLKFLGARLKDVNLPSLKYATLANAVIYANEFFAAHKHEVGRLLRASSVSRRARLYLGALSSAADYIKAQQVRSRVKREFAETFGNVDILALPAQLQPAPRLEGTDPLATLYKNLTPDFAGPFNLAGLPTIGIPCGFNNARMPVALQLVAKPFDEPTLLRAAYTYQQHAKHFEKRPPM